MRAHSFHQILLDCNLKANAFYAIHGLEPVKMATISKLPKNKASTPQCGFILGRKGHFAFPGVLIRARSISIPYL
jgi:hypothetical protein